MLDNNCIIYTFPCTKLYNLNICYCISLSPCRLIKLIPIYILKNILKLYHFHLPPSLCPSFSSLSLSSFMEINDWNNQHRYGFSFINIISCDCTTPCFTYFDNCWWSWSIYFSIYAWRALQARHGASGQEFPRKRRGLAGYRPSSSKKSYRIPAWTNLCIPLFNLWLRLDILDHRSLLSLFLIHYLFS